MDYEQKGMVWNHFLVIILSYELLHEAQSKIIKMCQAVKIVQASFYSLQENTSVWEVKTCRVRVYGTKHVDTTP